MRTRERLWRWLRAEASHRLGRPAKESYRAGWEEAEREEPRSSAQGEAETRLRRAYRALELPDGASLAEVRSSYKTLMKRYHPDRFQDGEKREAATELVKRLNEAYSVLLEHLEAQPGR